MIENLKISQSERFFILDSYIQNLYGKSDERINRVIRDYVIKRKIKLSQLLTETLNRVKCLQS